jgi:sugar/nucleoside kinase (ribokinase family)
MPRVHVVGYLSIDRIATPLLRRDNVPGGAALYAALGARAAGGDVALHAAAGEDFAQAWLDALGRMGIDLACVVRRPGRTRRARLVHAANGARLSDHDAEWWARTAALAPPLPAEVAPGDVVVVGPMPAAGAAGAIAHAAGARVVADTSEAFAAREPQVLRALLPRLAVFAPSREETRLLLPGLDDDRAALALAAAGCMIMQKRGADGVVVVAGADAPLLRLPAPPVDVVDRTGAGDATVGALAAGLAAGLQFADAARRALAVGAATVTGVGPSALGLLFECEHVR